MTWEPDIIIVDGKNAHYRSAHAHRTLSSTDIEGNRISTGGIFGFLNTLLQIQRQYAAPVEIHWEGVGVNWRYDFFPGYKGNRSGQDTDVVYNNLTVRETVALQAPQIVELMQALGIAQFEPSRGEADDSIIARARARVAENGDRVMLVSSDQDLLQAVTDDIRQTTSTQVWTRLDVEEDLAGLDSSFVPDIKAFAGDTSDNYPGCPGLGRIKTLAMLAPGMLRAEQAIELARRGELTSTTPKINAVVAANADLILRCKTLARACDCDPIRMEFVDPPSGERSWRMISELGMDSLVDSVDRLRSLSEDDR